MCYQHVLEQQDQLLGSITTPFSNINKYIYFVEGGVNFGEFFNTKNYYTTENYNPIHVIYLIICIRKYGLVDIVIHDCIFFLIYS